MAFAPLDPILSRAEIIGMGVHGYDPLPLLERRGPCTHLEGVSAEKSEKGGRSWCGGGS